MHKQVKQVIETKKWKDEIYKVLLVESPKGFTFKQPELILIPRRDGSITEKVHFVWKRVGGRDRVGLFG